MQLVESYSVLVYQYMTCVLLTCQMKELQHSNICVFIGACIEMSELILVMEYCSRGTLQVYFCNLQHLYK